MHLFYEKLIIISLYFPPIRQSMIRYALLFPIFFSMMLSYAQEIPPEAIFYLMRQPGMLQPEISGPDSICEGSSATFQVPGAAHDDSLVWQVEGPAEITFSEGEWVDIRSTGPGKVSVIARRLTIWGDGVDSLSVTVMSNPALNLGGDTVICEGLNLTLRAPENFASYRWQDQSSTDTLEISKTGTYWLVVSDSLGCKAQDVIEVNVASVPKPDLGPDLATCKGASYQLNPGVFAEYKWKDGSTNPTYMPAKAGTFWVEVTNICGNKARDTVKIKKWNGPSIDLGKNVFFCEGDTVELDAGEGFVSYRWQDGSIRQTLPVYETGLYKVIAKDKEGCTVVDSAYFEIENCITDLGLPLAFTPNDDGLNDVFKPLSLKNVQSMAIQIFDGEGTLVYLSNSKKASWNGQFQNKKLPGGEYIYSIQYKLRNSEKKYDAGSVKLRR